MSETTLTLKVHRLRPDARVPLKAHDTDMGFDLFAVEPHLAENGVHRCPTGVAVELPEGWGGLILGRSSLAAKGIGILGGVIDPSYKGELIVCLWVPKGYGFRINPGDRIAQLVLVRAPRVVIEEASDLAPSARGANGFGSSGR